MVFTAMKFYQDMSNGLHCDIGDQEWAENIFIYTPLRKSKLQFALYLHPTRDVAQVVEYTSGACGRRFKSCHPDSIIARLSKK